MDLSELLDDLAAVPRLPGAMCRDDPALFDLARDHRNSRGRALTVCQSCAALEQCREWVLTLEPDERPRGVVAGMVINVGRPRQRQRHR
jgi:hypothetical protein